MSTPIDESTLSRFLESARHKVATGMAATSKQTPGAALQVAADLQAIGGEAAKLDRAELSKAAKEGEDAARLLAAGKAEALVPCMRSLRRLSYLLQETANGQTSEKIAPQPAARSGPRKALIIDDSPVAALALSDVFESHDFSVRLASSMQKATELFVSFDPDVLVSDVHMPNIDIADLCRRFRTHTANRRSAIILVSGRTETELRDKLAAIKPDAFVSKLSGAEAVVARVNAICRDLFG